MAANNEEVSIPYKVSRGTAIWTPEDPMDVRGAESLLHVALQVVSDKRIKKLKINLEDRPGLPLAGFQILTALRRDLLSEGRECEVEGCLMPFGARAW